MFESFRTPSRKPALQLTKRLDHLTSKIQTVLFYHAGAVYLQQEQIKTFQLKNSYQATLTLGSLALEELQSWINSISSSTGRSLIQKPPQITTQKDAPKTGWITFANGQKNKWCLEHYGKDSTQQIQDLNAIYLALLTFTKEKKKKMQQFLPDRQYICPDLNSEDGGTQN